VTTPRAVHLLGVGGAGMSAIARLAALAGYRVSGTDREESPTLAALREVGVHAEVGHTTQLPDGIDAVVVSTAIRQDNPALVAARERGVEVIHRADFLAELMRGRRGLAVAGAHGKSTTSAMLTLALGSASACVGATMPGGGGTGALWGDGPWFVAEADESDRSLLRLSPEAAIVTNVEHEHHATYATFDDVRDVYRAFVDALPADGLLVLGPDDEARALASAAQCEVRYVGPAEGEWGRIGWAGSEYPPAGPWHLRVADGRVVPLSLAAPGRHNLENAACALAVADWCGVPLELAAQRLASFTGVGRRFEERGSAGGVRVVDDYAHHPTEVRATLAAARAGHSGRIIAVFQPHLFSRTRALSGELGASLAGADVAVVTEVYASREDVDPDISGRLVADAVPAPTVARFAPSLSDAADAVMGLVRPGDLVITIGAGDVTDLGQELLSRLAIRFGDGEDGDSGPPA
jgi:UDP-N-acetylmuramate--alanine ligase